MLSSGTFVSDLVTAIEREPGLDKRLKDISALNAFSAAYANNLVDAQRACAEYLAFLVDPEKVQTQTERAVLVAGMQHRMVRVLLALTMGIEGDPCVKNFLKKEV